MYPHERSLVKNLQNQPFALLGVNSDKDRDQLKEDMQKEAITWRSWFDGSTSGPIAKQWRVTGWPTLYLIYHRGVIRLTGDDARDLKKLDAAILLLVREAKAEEKKNLASRPKEPSPFKSVATPTEAAKPTERIPDDKDKQDELARTRFKFAKALFDDGKKDKARDRLQDIIKKFPNSSAADEAKELLKKLK